MTDTRIYQQIEQAIHYLENHAEEQPGLEVVAREVGLSPYHFQRTFKRLVGVTPKQFLQYTTLEAAKKALTQSPNLLDVAFAVGLSGPGRLHDVFINGEAATPGEVKQGGAGMTIECGIHETAFGWCFIALTPHGICQLDFRSEQEAIPTCLQRLSRTWPNAAICENSARTAPLVTAMLEGGQACVKRLPLHIRGTNFQLKVWQALLAVPEGSLTDYSSLARAIGHPTATRAVGSAVGDNPISFLIPCHRVLRKDGGIGGYASGLPRKRTMLAYEALSCQPDIKKPARA